VRSTPLSLLGDNADLAIEGVTNTAKNAIDAVSPNTMDKSNKKDKNQKKKNKKKKS
jgi:hypothetical protein